jgi:hypothetical protein
MQRYITTTRGHRGQGGGWGGVGWGGFKSHNRKNYSTKLLMQIVFAPLFYKTGIVGWAGPPLGTEGDARS